jgi:hypothetical protein
VDALLNKNSSLLLPQWEFTWCPIKWDPMKSYKQPVDNSVKNSQDLFKPELGTLKDIELEIKLTMELQ